MQADPEWKRDNALHKWITLARSGQIEDEYGHEVSLEIFLIMVMVRNPGSKSSLIDYGPDVTGPYFKMFEKHYFDCGGFDFSDQEFS